MTKAPPSPASADASAPAATQTLRGIERSLPIALLRAREATMRLFKPYVDAAGLTLPQWRVIRALAERGAHDAAELADRCAVLPPSLSRILATLEARGLIARGREAEDGRRWEITLTTEGAALFAQMEPTSEAVYRNLEDSFGAERLSLLLVELEALTAIAGTQSEDDPNRVSQRRRAPSVNSA